MKDYYTVTEFSKLTGKDPGNIRRMLINKEIHGEKLGSQWIIPKQTILPADKRVKSGEYRNWRKRKIVNDGSPSLLKALTDMSRRLKIIYGDSLERIVLYGSYARGEQMEGSDVDIAILLKNGNTDEMHDAMIDVVVDYELDLGLTLSVIPIEYDNYIKWINVLPFYKNIDKEGIVLWKAV